MARSLCWRTRYAPTLIQDPIIIGMNNALVCHVMQVNVDSGVI